MPLITELEYKLKIWSTTSRPMKPMRSGTNKELAKDIQDKRSKCLVVSKNSAAENWFNEKLKNWKYSRQAIWGFRIYDFWFHDLGVAIEVDGTEHRKDYDDYRDEYNFRRSAIIVIHIRNFNEDDALMALNFITDLNENWEQRRHRLQVKKRALLGCKRISRKYASPQVLLWNRTEEIS